jgi:hypothetical protein
MSKKEEHEPVDGKKKVEKRSEPGEKTPESQGAG